MRPKGRMSDARNTAIHLIDRYYAAFNTGDGDGMVALVDDNVVHDVNQGGRRVGRVAFAAFLDHMDRCYAEQVIDLVVLANDEGTRAAAEFTVTGAYQATDEGLPEASGQTYSLPGGAFFEIAGGRITRVTTYYNRQEWIAQVGA